MNDHTFNYGLAAFLVLLVCAVLLASYLSKYSPETKRRLAARGHAPADNGPRDDAPKRMRDERQAGMDASKALYDSMRQRPASR